MIIGSNTAVQDVWTNYSQNVNSLSKVLKQMASAIKNTEEDPAGVGISSRLFSQFYSTAVAVQNIENGISAIQTTDAWAQQINDSMSRMKELTIEYNSGTLSAADKANLETEFKSLQENIEYITSRPTAAAQFDGIELLQGGTVDLQAGDSIDQVEDIELADLSTNNTSEIGNVVTYDDDGNAVETPVTWNEIIDSITGMKIGDDLAIGKLDVAVDYVSQTRAQNGVDISKLENARESLMDYEANLNEAATNISGVDEAFAATQMSTLEVLTSSDISILSQGNNIPALAMMELLS